MPQAHIDTRKNPLHPSSLRINDLTVGRHIVVFNLKYGIHEQGVIVSRPHNGHLTDPLGWPIGTHKHLVVTLRSDAGVVNLSLADIGVLPYPNMWNDRNFTIDARKRHLLPKPNRTLYHEWEDDDPTRWSFGDSDWIELEEEE